jgi:hypothetical protein
MGSDFDRVLENFGSRAAFESQELYHLAAGRLLSVETHPGISCPAQNHSSPRAVSVMIDLAGFSAGSVQTSSPGRSPTSFGKLSGGDCRFRPRC